MGNQFDEIADIIDNARTRAMRAVCTMTSVRQHLKGGKNTTDYYILCQIAKLVNEGSARMAGVFSRHPGDHRRHRLCFTSAIEIIVKEILFISLCPLAFHAACAYNETALRRKGECFYG